MTASEKEVELEARILAMEYLLKMSLWNIIIMRTDEEDGDDDLAIRETKLFRKNINDQLKKALVSGGGPAMSDHVASLVRDHAVRVLDELVQEMEVALAQGLSSRGNF